MNSSMKIYKKAIKSYNEGKINKAIVLCEKSISEDIKNNASINLKGLLYYLTGDLQSAVALWKLNSQVNEDSVSKKYLEGVSSDERKAYYYQEALDKIEKLRINEAVDLLLKCSESDFNFINVNNHLAFCCIKLGEFEKAKEAIEKVLQLDKNNSLAKENKKLLISYGVIKKEINYKKITASFLVLLLVSAVIVFYKSNKKVVKNVEPPKKAIENKAVIHKVEEKKEEKKEESFPYDEILKAVNSNNYEEIYSYLEIWKEKGKTLNEKSLIVKGEAILKKDGVSYFYKKGREMMKASDYKGAREVLLKGFKYGDNNYLFEHIMYLLGICSEKTMNIDEALSYYNRYNISFPKGDYEDLVLYKLVILNKDIDKNEAKKYAKRIITEYPNSEYNNSIIKSVLD